MPSTAAFASARLTAVMMPFELYVAPDTASTFGEPAFRILAMTAVAFVKYGSVSPGALSTVIEAICPFAMTTCTVIVPPKPRAAPVYVPSR